MRSAIFASALLCAPLLIHAAPHAVPVDSDSSLQTESKRSAKPIFPALPPYPRGYTWVDCTVVPYKSARFHNRKRDLISARDDAAPAPASAPEPAADDAATDLIPFPEDLLELYPPSPTEEIPSPERPTAALSTRGALEPRKEFCGVTPVYHFANLPHTQHSTNDYFVDAGRNLAFSVASNVVIRSIQLHYQHNGRFILGPQVRPNGNSAVLNWHAALNTAVYYVVTFAHAGVTGNTRLIDSAPVR